MTNTEYEKLRARIEDRYHQDLAALERIRNLFRDDDEPLIIARQEQPPRRRSGSKKLSRSDAMKASWLRRRTGKLHGDEKGISPKAFSKFLVKGPTGAGGNGDE